MRFFKVTIKDDMVRFKILGIKFKFRVSESKRKKSYDHQNSIVIINKPADDDQVIVGKKSYGNIYVESWSDDVKLVIGNYVSIGPNVHFILSSEHPYTGISTYPFKVRLGLQKFEATNKGNIVVDDDVWIGLGAIICSGVHIGQGAVIAAGAVVTKDVEPYSIVSGNPARHIKYRFGENIRKELMSLDFSKLDEQKIIDNIDAVYTKLTDDNVKDILNKIK